MGEAQRYLARMLARSTDECLVWPYNLAKGYGQTTLGGRKRNIHQLVCEWYHGPRPSGMNAAHGPCHNRACFNPRHLSWKTPAANQADRLRDGTDCRGERHPMARLTEREVREIRQQYATGEWKQRELADEFGISRVQVTRIVNGRSW